MNKICTSLEQSKKLIELGIDVDTADMTHITLAGREGVKTILISKEAYNILVTPFSEVRKIIPAWSLSALLNIIKNRKDCNKVEFFSNYASKWVLTTTYYDSVWKEKEFIAEYPIDAAFEMIVLLKENGKI